MEEAKSGIDALLKEDRYFPPPPEFTKLANIQDPDIYEKAEADFEGFWANWAEELSWFMNNATTDFEESFMDRTCG